jgi:hypothetical protein
VIGVLKSCCAQFTNIDPEGENVRLVLQNPAVGVLADPPTLAENETAVNKSEFTL